MYLAELETLRPSAECSSPLPLPTMLGAAAALLLCLLPSQVNALITTDAKCLAGNDWMFSSIGQSPCDVAAELASVCIGTTFTVDPLPAGYIYSEPTVTNANSCRCSSVFYSLMSACAYCQNAQYLRWGFYTTNCSKVYLATYPQQIPIGVKVPAYAYQDVSISDTFNVTLAYGTKHIESSRLPASSTQMPTRSPSSSASAAASSGSSSSDAGSVNNTPAIIGGAVGGVIGFGLIAALITFIVLRSKRSPKSENYNSSFQQSPNMAFTPTTMASLIQSTPSLPPGSPGMMIYNPNGHADPNVYDPNRQHSPPSHRNVMSISSFTGNSAQTMPQNTDGRSSQYTGRPEF